MSENHTLWTPFGHGCLASHVGSDTPPPVAPLPRSFHKKLTGIV